MNYHINKKVGKPYNAADAQHADFPKFGGRGAPMVVDIGGVRQGVSELLHASSLYKAVWYLLRLCRSFEVKSWFLQFGGIGALWGGPSGVRRDFLRIALQSP